MLGRWGAFVARRRWLVLGASGLGLLLSIVLLATVAPSLESDGFVNEKSESARVEGALAPLVDEPAVSRVLTTWNTGNPAFISHDGQSTYAVAQLAPDADIVPDDLRHEIEPAAAAGLTVSATGGLAIGEAISASVEEGIIRAETISIPLTLLIQVIVFGGLIAAGAPLLIAALAIVGATALVFLLSTAGFQSIFAVNIITMLGLGLGIDYSLFMVARFREELPKRPVEEAVAVSMATVGKAILFSGVTVIFGLAATHFFPLPALHSMGQAGMLVVALAVLYGLTFLPALLAALGPRINAIPVGRRGGKTQRGREGEGFWHRVAERVMARPVAVLAAVLVVLVVAGLPFLRLDLTPGGPEVLPSDNPARMTYDRLSTDFPAGEAEPAPVLLTAADGNALSPASVAAQASFAAEASRIPGVLGVNGLTSAAADYDWTTYNGDPATLPAEIQAAIGQNVRGADALIEVATDREGAELEALVRGLRAISTPGLTVQVGGAAGASVDTIDGIADGVLPALLFVIVGSYLILLLTFGSVFLPLKAIFMTLLSISASLGALVWIFQDGRLEGLLGFEATGEIISTTPILMFCILFGLSMDYEVLMLSRIQEEYRKTGDNRASVAFGLERTATVITGAAAIMVVVFGAFMAADIVIIKSMGFGLALAVLIDATIVRGLLVPATMRLMGRWNWWAPAGMRRVVDRLGLGHTEPAGAPVGAVARAAD